MQTFAKWYHLPGCWLMLAVCNLGLLAHLLFWGSLRKLWRYHPGKGLDMTRIGWVQSSFSLSWSSGCFVLSWSCFDMSVEHFARLLGFVDLRWLDWRRMLDVACVLHFCLFKHVQAAFYSEDLTAKSDWTPASAVSRTWHLDTSKSLPFAQKIHKALAGIVGSNSSWKNPQEQVLQMSKN